MSDQHQQGQSQQGGTAARMRASQSQQTQQELQQQLEQEFQPRLVTWEQINQPGAYVDTQSGDLYSIPKQALIDGQPVIGRESQSQTQLLQVSTNPFITTLQAGRIAARNGVQVNFQ